MKKFKFTKIVSFALAMFMAFSVFTVNVSAASRGDAYKRQLTAEEIATIKTVFDAKYYGSVYLDVVHFYGYDYYTPAIDDILFAHFINCGIWEERQPSAAFNVDVYASRNTDLQPQFGDDIIAYYMYYATHLKEQSWRVVPTLNDAWLSRLQSIAYMISRLARLDQRQEQLQFRHLTHQLSRLMRSN